MASRRREVQKLLTQAEALVQQAAQICIEDDLEGVSFMDQTFHIYKEYYGLGRCRLQEPGWFTDEYWQSSSAYCELEIVRPEEEET